MTTAAEIVDGLTNAEVRAFALHALTICPELAPVASALAVAAPQASDQSVKVVRIPYRDVLTPDQVAAIKREWVPKGRGKRGSGPSIQQLADKHGVSYGAAWRAVYRDIGVAA